MRILVVGSGGREHAIVHGLAASRSRPEIFVAPGNAGTADCAQNIDIESNDIDGLLRFAITNEMNLTVVGPELPLVRGIVDVFRDRGLMIVGPTATAARLEGSKAFAKDFMARYQIPTASFRIFERHQVETALEYLVSVGAPVVVKASGLAAGKGAIVCLHLDEARDAVKAMLSDDRYGAAGHRIVIEEYMEGEEASVFALCDGETYVLLETAQDHKRVGEHDQGPNTGGMGAYAPAPIVDDETLQRVRQEIIEPTLSGLAADGFPYTGFLYAGLMLTPLGPRVVEFNCRLGDPEAQVVLPLLDADLVSLLDACARSTLSSLPEIKSRPGAAACVVLCSGGYPGSYEKGIPIHGLQDTDVYADTVVLHAGTRRDGDRVITAGGRVLGVTAVGDDLAGALASCYRAVDHIRFEGMHYRRDIGARGLRHLATA